MNILHRALEYWTGTRIVSEAILTRSLVRPSSPLSREQRTVWTVADALSLS